MMRTTSMKIIGQDANGKNLCVCHFECDSSTDLPAYNVYQSDGYVFAMSCTAHTIDADKKYELDSAGNWVEQSQPWKPLADYSVLSNKPQINGHTLTGNQSGADLGLQNSLAFDNTPIQNSTNPVTSGGIWTDQQRQATEIGVVANAGAKNVLYYTKVGTSVESGSQYLSNGVRFTMQSDGSVLVNRESSNVNESFCNLRLDSASRFIDDYCNGQYVLSGSYGDCILRATNNTYNEIDSDGNGVVLQDRGAQTSIWVQIRVAASASPNNVLVKPMIRPAAITDPAFQPYAPTNRELYEMILALQ